jgi:hypothetical protein
MFGTKGDTYILVGTKKKNLNRMARQDLSVEVLS